VPAVLAVDDSVMTALAGFRTASAELPDRWLLQRRLDRKFVFSSALLEPLLSALAPHFSVLRAGVAPIATYQTVYFDTAGRQFYEDHRRGRLPRHKVRLRHHLERRLSFLEVKRKTADGRTTKARLERPFGDQPWDSGAAAFVLQSSRLAPAALHAQLSMTFKRITLVGDHVDERMTVDSELEMWTDGARRPLPGVAIAEVKQACYANDTPSVRGLRALHLRERGFSKYCLGTAMLAPVRSHAFGESLRLLERLGR
jgi:hypothetical protein